MLTLFFCLRDCFRRRILLQAETLALRHQLLVYNVRAVDGSRPLGLALPPVERLAIGALLILKPETIIAWHRKGFRFYWRWKSRHREGRPPISSEVRNLIGK